VLTAIGEGAPAGALRFLWGAEFAHFWQYPVLLDCHTQRAIAEIIAATVAAAALTATETFGGWEP
jgi:hypothetical protein